jgi:hypothetical protein
VQYPPLFRFERGDHACLFYRSEDLLVEILTSYIAEGLEKHEKCFCVQQPHVRERLLEELRQAGVDTAHEIQRGALELATHRDTYFPESQFRPASVIRFLAESIRRSRRQGYRGFRSVGDLSWAFKGGSDCPAVVRYERMVNAHYHSRSGSTGLCTYPLGAVPPKTCAGILDAHKLSMDEREPSLYVTMQMREKPYVTDIVRDRYTLNPHYSYVVSHEKSDRVLDWGTAPTINAARASSRRSLRRLSSGNGSIRAPRPPSKRK